MKTKLEMVAKARQIMAQLLSGEKITFASSEKHEDLLAERRRDRFKRVPRRGARRESLKRFRRRLWGHKSLRQITARGRKGRRLKRGIIKQWYHDDKRRQSHRV